MKLQDGDQTSELAKVNVEVAETYLFFDGNARKRAAGKRSCKV